MSRKSIADALKRNRIKSGKSAAEIAKFVGKSEKTVYAWERCNGQPDADTLISLSNLYGINSFQEFEDDITRISRNDSWHFQLIAAYEKADIPIRQSVCRVLDIGYVDPLANDADDMARYTSAAERVLAEKLAAEDGEIC